MPVRMPSEMPARAPAETNDVPMVEQEPFYHQAIEAEQEKPMTDFKEPPTSRKSDNGAINSDGIMDKPGKPSNMGEMDKPMKPSGVEPKGEKSPQKRLWSRLLLITPRPPWRRIHQGLLGRKKVSRSVRRGAQRVFVNHQRD